MPVEAVWAEHPQIVGTALAAHAPLAFDAVARTHGIAPWDLVEMVLVVDVEDSTRATAVDERQHHTTLPGALAPVHVQLVRQCARRADPPRLNRELGHGWGRRGRAPGQLPSALSERHGVRQF